MSPYARRLYLTDFLPKNLIEMAPFLGVRKLIIWLFECQADFDASYGYFARVSAQTSEQSLEQSTKQALIGLRTGQVMLWIRYFNQRGWDVLRHAKFPNLVEYNEKSQPISDFKDGSLTTPGTAML